MDKPKEEVYCIKTIMVDGTCVYEGAAAGMNAQSRRALYLTKKSAQDKVNRNNAWAARVNSGRRSVLMVGTIDWKEDA